MAKKKAEPKVTAKTETIITDISDLISAVTKDIKKDFDISAVELGKLEYLSTGNPGINYAFSGRVDGGFPQSLISELSGMNSTGKTLLALHALAETQKKGGVAILVDSEYAFNPEWFVVLGGDPEKLVHYEPEHIENAYMFIQSTVESIRAKNKDLPISIAYDSIAASPSAYEVENGILAHDFGKRAIAHGKGIRMLMGLCKKHNVTFIAINQLRATMDPYNPFDTVGGKSWQYACSLRVELKKGKKINVKSPTGGEKVVGIHGRLEVKKNRLRAPFAKSTFDIYFDSGIDPVSGLADVLCEEGVIKPRINEEGKITKGWWTYEGTHFQMTNFNEILQKHPNLLGGCKMIEVPQDATIVSENDDDDEGRTVQDADM